MKLLKHSLLLFVILLCLFSACKKDELITDTAAKLAFSTDSILFDTVFTTVGSTTKLFKIYNPYNQPINITKAYLATGNSSQFRINIDGVSGTLLQNIEIAGGDSLFVFVQVTVNPTNQNAPLLINDSIVFETNGNIQDVNLTAVGQDVYLHKPNVFPTNGLPPYSIIGCDEIWTNDKPHLIFGYAVVDEGCSLTIMPGTRVHLGVRSVLWVYDGGTLIVSGAKGQEVVFQGSRLEPDYQDVSGQWGKIWLSRGSINNKIDWAIIKNGNIGVQADTLGASTAPTLKITNTIIKTMTTACIYGQGSYITGNNCVFANSDEYIGAFTIGGKYKFEHCTFANFGNGSRSTALLALNNYYVDITNTLQIRDLDSAYFGNCILYGDLEDEIGLDSSISGGVFSYKFDHCIVKTTLNTDNGLHYNNVYKNTDPGFKDVSTQNYNLLNSSSFAVDKATTSIFIEKDLNNESRPNLNISSLPDVGAYEFY